MRRLIWFLAVAAALFFLIFVWRAPWLSLGVLALSHALFLYPTLRPNVQWFGPVLTVFETGERELWLTIDDGPADDTPQLLEILSARGVRATFFAKGELALQRPELVRAILEGGHTLGNHTQTHPSGTFWCLSPRSIRDEIDACSDSLERITGAPPPHLFRAPVGMKNVFVHPALRRRRMHLVGWSIRAFDAVRSDVGWIVRSVERQLRPGAILVLHQGHAWSLRAIDGVITAAQRNGYAFVVPPADRLKTNR